METTCEFRHSYRERVLRHAPLPSKIDYWQRSADSSSLGPESFVTKTSGKKQRLSELWEKSAKLQHLSHSGIGHLRSASGRKLEGGPQTPGDPGAGAKAHPKGGREPHKGASPPTRAAPTGATPAGGPGGQSPQGGPTPGRGVAGDSHPPAQQGRAPGDTDPRKNRRGGGDNKRETTK